MERRKKALLQYLQRQLGIEEEALKKSFDVIREISIFVSDLVVIVLLT